MSKSLPIVAIVGRANVGKSSLFNRLAGKRQAIVSEIAGTTRDRVITKVEFGRKQCFLVDTAGLKHAESELELNIQEQITQATTTADVILVVVESDIGITPQDREIAKKALKTKKPVFLIIAKADKPSKLAQGEFKKLGIKSIFAVSSIHGYGTEELEEAISKTLPMSKYEVTDSPKIAILGRPNVGKSALFNNILKEKRAVVSEEAGTTRDVNRSEIVFKNQPIELLDTAGIRNNSKNVGLEYYSSLRTLAAIEEADVCVLLVDATEPATKLDLKIAGMVKTAEKGLIIALSKWDLVDKGETTFDEMAPELHYSFQFVPWAPLIVTSAVKNKNTTKLLELALEIIEGRKKEIATKDLNNWLITSVSHHPPAGLKNTYPKLKYVTQVGSSPPIFRFFGRYLKTLHWSYKRYLERELREKFDITGTAIRLEFQEEENER